MCLTKMSDCYTSYWVCYEICRICTYCFSKTQNILNSETHLFPNVSDIRDPYLDLGLNGKNEYRITSLITKLASGEKQKEQTLGLLQLPGVVAIFKVQQYIFLYLFFKTWRGNTY